MTDMSTDRVVAVTGAASGIGAALTARFLANGDRVVAIDVRQEALDGLTDCRDNQAALLGVQADISSQDDCRRAAARAAERWDQVDVLVNCASIFPVRAFEEMTLDEWRRVIDINLTGTFLMIRAMLPLMKGRGWGRIVNIGSATFFSGGANLAHYVASKGGVIGLSRSLATELGKYGITVNVVTPGLTVTDTVTRDYPAEMIAKARFARPIQKDMQAEDITGAVFFLASPEAGFMTGQIVNVDGGSFKH